MGQTERPGVIQGQQGHGIALLRGQRPNHGLHISERPNSHSLQAADDRRRYQRVKLALHGRFMRQNGEEYPCRILNVSAGGIAVQAPVSGQPGERIVMYLDTLGRIEGEIVRSHGEGFALNLSMTGYKREKIVNQLTWLVNRDRMASLEDRQHERIVPSKTTAKLTLQNGSEHDCFVLDVSQGGAKIDIKPKPDVGQEVILGLIRGRVVRHFETGISIEFMQIQDPATLERQFG